MGIATISQMMTTLRSEQIGTWFDLGLFIDRFREDRPVPAVRFTGTFQDFREWLSDGSVALVAFDQDRIAAIVKEYRDAIRTVLGDIRVHQIAGAFDLPTPSRHSIREMQGFENWPLFSDMFDRRLERGGETYNRLISTFWDSVLTICQGLGSIIESEGIRLLYLIDVCAVPGNVALSLAVALLSELLHVPVIHHSQGYFWASAQNPYSASEHLGEVSSQLNVLFPWESRSWMNVSPHPEESEALVRERGQNPANVAVIEPTGESFHQILYQLYLQISQIERGSVADSIKEYGSLCQKEIDDLLPSQNQVYLPGFGRTSYMLYLKSLIDPSFFRVEEQEFRGMLMSFAQDLVEAGGTLDLEKRHQFYNAVDDLFMYWSGEIKTRHDHSFAYRHRNTRHYPYRDFTHQELTGLVNLLFHRMTSPAPALPAAIAQTRLVTDPVLDDRDRLEERLQINAPRAYFPGDSYQAGLEALILRPARNCLDLAPGSSITAEQLEQRSSCLARVSIFCRERSCGRRVTADSMIKLIDRRELPELSLLSEYGLVQIIPTQQWCVGIHFPQLGESALTQLRQIREASGFLVTDDHDAAMMTDIVGIDRFHIGQINDPLSARIMGIPEGSSYVQFAPARVRTTLAYPTPIQTAKDFSDALHSPQYHRLCRAYGPERVMDRIRGDVERAGTPVRAVLDGLGQEDRHKSNIVENSTICGVFRDGQPWNGAIARIKVSKSSRSWRFAILTGNGKTQPVTSFAEEFQTRWNVSPAVAWNGGYILNPELVGKLGLPETFIGSPLGLIITEGQVVCPPLYNKAAFLIRPGGRLEIRRVNCSQGLMIADDKHRFDLGPDCRNPQKTCVGEICFYDLLHSGPVTGAGRVIVRMAGNTIKEIIRTQDDDDISILPVGLTLSFPLENFPTEWDRVGKRLRVEIPGLGEIEHAVEAGPLLVVHGQPCIDMASGGWQTEHSIRTQAARIDYVDMRGPKIAIGLDSAGDLLALAINGRIRESVGASHQEIAEILCAHGVETAMGFDPGGSSTLLVHGKTVNISPYNSGYESDIYSLPPEPRAVASAVIAYQI